MIAGNLRADDAKAMPAVLRRQFVPDKVVLLRPTGKKAPANTRLAGFTRNLAAREGRATAYVCVNYCCRLPTADAGKMLALLNASG